MGQALGGGSAPTHQLSTYNGHLNGAALCGLAPPEPESELPIR